MIRLRPFNFAHEVVVNVDLLNALAAAFVHLMYHDLLDEGVQQYTAGVDELNKNSDALKSGSG